MRPLVGSTDFLMRVCWDAQGHSLNDLNSITFAVGVLLRSSCSHVIRK